MLFRSGGRRSEQEREERGNGGEKEKKLEGTIFKKYTYWDSPGGAVVKNPPANAGDMGSSPGPGRSHLPQSN